MEPPKRGHYEDGHFALSVEVVLFQRFLFWRMRSEGYSIIGLCVCLSVSNLTYGASVRSENAVTYSAGNESQGETTAFQSYAKSQHFIIPAYLRLSFSAWHTTKRQRLPNNSRQHSALPKTKCNIRTISPVIR